MALRIYPVRPLRYGRGYYGAQQQASPYAGAFKAGGSMGAELAKGIGAAMKAHQQQQQQDALNAQANQIENTVAPPRAGLVAPGVNPQTGAANAIGANVPTAGTAPFSTGVAGMQLQQNFIKSQLENQKLAMELRNQGVAANLQARRGGGGGGGGDGGNASRWQQYLGGGGQDSQSKGKTGKPAAYQAGSSTADQPNYYNFNNQRADVDAQYGKGTYDKLLANAGNISVDPKTGKYVSADPDSVDVNPDTGDVTLKSSTGHAGAHIPFNDVQANMTRYDGTLVQQGKQPRFSDQYLKTKNPQSGLPNGDAANPYTPSNTAELQAIAPGKSFVNPTDGKVYQKQPPQQPAAQQQPPAKGTTQVDTGDQGQGLAGGQQSPQQALPPSLLQPLPGGLTGAQPQGLAGAQDQGQGTDYTAGGAQPSSMPQPATPPVDQSALLAGNAAPGIFNVGQPVGGGLPQGVDLGDEIKRSQMADYLTSVA